MGWRGGPEQKAQPPRTRPLLGRVERFSRLGAAADRDPPRLHSFGDLTDQIDLKKAVVVMRLLDFNVVFQIEATRKGSSRDAPMQVLPVILVRLAAFYRQKILLAGDSDLVGGKSGDRDRDAVSVVAGPHNIVRRVSALIFSQLGVVQKIEQVVEADARPREGSKVESPHNHILR
jgi:hypothetical protein